MATFYLSFLIYTIYVNIEPNGYKINVSCILILEGIGYIRKLCTYELSM